ncbi:hypothetical protein GGI25_002355 [Coemansia spiralis]|uniref:F-box domain-containing protein n=2 Tax=Coemansia TaxID=4863 RepID=A0A9W8KYJ0_9FUNG|nr:hypothetical protein BX070DRAFT_250625 [Coemansia spiralis]KAJ1990040.1 hypothetical protein EDC05_004302 [Coemansia umbellata]KAJ2622159.1 hypothetical protein GGI26_003454 [Coemansia sp. RSA 1358]KAJ2678370.1 hypothetical protein GGI25_002355 [Coemansia spiralis]
MIDTTAAGSIAALPDDLLFRIFALCNGDDLRALSEVSRRFWLIAKDDFLWRVIYRKRFGEEPAIDRTRTYQSQYNSKDCLILAVAEDCEIAHGRPPYWTRASDPRSVFGKVALLHAVSWLHVHGQLAGVHSGKYRVVWRLSVLPRAQYIFDILFRAKSARGSTVESQLPLSASLLNFGSDYFDFVIPDILDVKAPFEDVLVECTCTSPEWKTNIALCSVRLEPVGDSTRAQRARAISCYSARGAGDRRSEQQLRRLGKSRLQPGAAYRPWQPWSMSSWVETVFMALFCLLLAVLFAQLLLEKTS